jgi:hypothetical protein
MSTLNTICSAAGSITERSLYHSWLKNVDRVVAQYALQFPVAAHVDSKPLHNAIIATTSFFVVRC